MTFRSPRLLLAVAGFYGAAGVAAGAVAAHRLDDPRLLTASTFLMIHAAALAGVSGAIVALGLGRIAMAAAWGLALGTLMFCGDLLLRVWLGSSPLPVAPFGGSLLILSWLALIAGALVPQRKA